MTMTHEIAAPRSFKPSHLQVVEAVPPVIGSPAWAAQLRNDARATASDLEQGYMRMGELLHLALTATVDNVAGGAPIYTAWGFTDYDKWVTEELGLHDRKARSLIRIYRRIDVEMGDLPAELRRRLLRLGWTKVRELARVLTVKNASEWAKLGEENNYNDLRRAVAVYVDGLKERAIADARDDAAVIAEREAARAGDPGTDSGDPGIDAMPPVMTVGAGFDDDGSDDTDPSADMPMPAVERTIPFNFALYPDQAAVFRDALAQAEAHDPGHPKSYYLEIMAREYLAAPFQGTTPEELKVNTLSRLAELFGLRIVAQDIHSGAVVIGHGTSLYRAIRDGEL